MSGPYRESAERDEYTEEKKMGDNELYLRVWKMVLGTALLLGISSLGTCAYVNTSSAAIARARDERAAAEAKLAAQWSQEREAARAAAEKK